MASPAGFHPYDDDPAVASKRATPQCQYCRSLLGPGLPDFCFLWLSKVWSSPRNFILDVIEFTGSLGDKIISVFVYSEFWQRGGSSLSGIQSQIWIRTLLVCEFISGFLASGIYHVDSVLTGNGNLDEFRG